MEINAKINYCFFLVNLYYAADNYSQPIFMTDSNMILADLLFSNLPHTPESLESLYPPRSVPMVTRQGPSPTGFLHIGTVYASLLSERIAHLNS